MGEWQRWFCLLSPRDTVFSVSLNTPLLSVLPLSPRWRFTVVPLGWFCDAPLTYEKPEALRITGNAPGTQQSSL